jgi:hypothetical protein
MGNIQPDMQGVASCSPHLFFTFCLFAALIFVEDFPNHVVCSTNKQNVSRTSLIRLNVAYSIVSGKRNVFFPGWRQIQRQKKITTVQAQ